MKYVHAHLISYWSRYLGIVSPVLQAEIDVLKNMLTFREDKQQCIFSRNEMESFIRAICTEQRICVVMFYSITDCHSVILCMYNVSQKTSPTFLAITRESIDGFL